jgi:hypothetical protein
MKVVRSLQRKYRPVPITRTAWLFVVGVCALAALLLAINGYTGYAVVLAAVGASAAVNLL